MSSLGKTWFISGNAWMLGDISTNKDKLDNGVYRLTSGLIGPYLVNISERFEFDFKIYGLEETFIKRVLKTYDSTTGNLGVLLNGIKGTGKTITAKILCNKLGMPVIIVDGNMPEISSFLSGLNQDVTILIDEFEKIFSGKIDEDEDTEEEGGSKGSTLLSLMDGVYTTSYRKVFILTTNRPWINENLLNRPGRLRYHKNFADLTKGQTQEIIDDLLVNKEFEDDIKVFLCPLKIVTVDIVKAIISQVNIFNESPEECCKDLNLEFKDTEYTIYEINGMEESILEDSVSAGQVEHLFDPKYKWKGRYIHGGENGVLYIVEKPDIKTGVITVSNNSKGEDPFKIRIVKKKHSYHEMAM